MKKLIQNILLVSATCFILTLAGYGQTVPKGFKIDYDKFKDQTRVSTQMLPMYSVLMDAGFIHPGTSINADQETFYIYFNGGQCRGFCFNDPTLILMIDGERETVGTERTLSDSAIFITSRDLIKRIAAAKLVEFQVGRYEGKFKDKDIEKFQTLLDLGTLK